MANYKFFCILLFVMFFTFQGSAQDTIPKSPADAKYREDQFYAGATYNLITDVPSGVSIRGLSGGFQFGYLRDMPLNKRRNIAIAVGGGLSFDEYGQTLFIGEDANESTIFTILDDQDVDFNRNRFSTSTIEAPIEIRWRTSTAESYKFWRVYTGFRVGYVYWYKSTFKQDGNTVTQTKIPEFDRLRLGATLGFGYNTFNFFVYYSINPFFKNAVTTNGQNVNFKTIRVGLMFYIL
jgi:hypothetical protein